LALQDGKRREENRIGEGQRKEEKNTHSHPKSLPHTVVTHKRIFVPGLDRPELDPTGRTGEVEELLRSFLQVPLEARSELETLQHERITLPETVTLTCCCRSSMMGDREEKGRRLGWIHMKGQRGKERKGREGKFSIPVKYMCGTIYIIHTTRPSRTCGVPVVPNHFALLEVRAADLATRLSNRRSPCTYPSRPPKRLDARLCCVYECSVEQICNLVVYECVNRVQGVTGRTALYEMRG